MSFLMIPLTFPYDEYIDRPKLSERKKKSIWVYSSSLHKGGWNHYPLLCSLMGGLKNVHLFCMDLIQNIANFF